MDYEAKFNELLEKGEIKKSGNWYNIYRGEKKIGLGMGKAKAISALKEMGNVEDLVSETANQPEVVQEETGNLATDNLVKDSIEDDLDIEGLLSNVRDINPDMDGGQDLDIYVDGVDSRLNNHPTIKNFPLSFYWMRKDHNVENGSGLTMNGQYTVLSKSWKQLIKPNGERRVTVLRDDTPEADFFSVGELVLCVCKKMQLEEKKKKMYANELIKSKVSEEQRNERAKNIAKVSDPIQAMNDLNNDNSVGRATQAEHLELNEGISATEAMNRIQKATGDEALELANSL